VRLFVRRAAAHGIDVFRVFDSLNWVENMRVAIDAVRESGALCEAAICYTGDFFDESQPKYDLRYYVEMAQALEKAGAHVLGIKDMAGICRPRAAHALVRALKDAVGLPIHLHTHDTSGISAASVLAAVDAGADAVDGALDAMSGLTSQPNLGSIAAALRGAPRDPGVDLEALKAVSTYWEGVRRYYAPFEADIRAGTSDVYLHEMPGGQYTNLREQARAMGLEHRWADISRTYAQVNLLFGDIVKVTPTSKVVGDMALFMVANDLDPDAVLDPDREIAFPESVVAMFRGDLGLTPGGISARAVAQDPEGRAAPHRPGGRAPAARGPRRQAPRPSTPRAGRPTTTTWRPTSCTRRSFGSTPNTSPSTATSRRSRRRCSSTAWRIATKSPSTSNGARPSSSQCRAAPTWTRTATCGCSSS
jgi:pyruvate carboxylase